MAPPSETSDAQDTDWNKEIHKWQHGIDVAKATQEDLDIYTQAKTHEYKLYSKVDSDLWDLFQDDFKDFDKSVFTQVARRHLQELRTCLRVRGVFVPKNSKNKTIPQTLYNTAQEEEQHEWTEEDINELLQDFDVTTVRSVRLTRRLQKVQIPGSASTSRNTPLYTPQTQARAGSLPPLHTAPAQPPVDRTAQPPLTQRSYGREIAEITKMYTEEQKYSGSGEDESLDHKLTIFYDICSRVDLPQELYVKAFPAMLKGLAQDHFYNDQLSQRTVEDICNNLRNFFEGPGYHRKNLDRWNGVTLASVIAKTENATKTTYECLQLLINTLRKLQYGLAPDLQSTGFLHNKLVTAY
jgi:hypothetical protein